MFATGLRIAAFKSRFSAHRNTAQSIPFNTLTKVQFNIEDYDDNSEYDHETDFKWVCKEAGKYSVKAIVGITSLADGEGISMIAEKNGTTGVLVDYLKVGGVGMSVVKVSGDVKFNVDDYIEIQVSHNMGAGKDTYINGGCCFSIRRFA